MTTTKPTTNKMPSSLKRKRNGESKELSLKKKQSSSSSSSRASATDRTNALDVFRRHFESQFGAVKGLSTPKEHDDSEENSDDDEEEENDNSHDDEWTGIDGEAEVDDSTHYPPSLSIILSSLFFFS